MGEAFGPAGFRLAPAANLVIEPAHHSACCVSGDPGKFQGDRAMSKSAKNSRATSRPPVDALQYEKLALSAFGLVERQLSQLDKLVTLAASIFRSPAVTREERHRQRKLLEVLIDTGEDYQREVEIDRELYQVIALDAKGVPQSCITARHAANLLAKASQTAPESCKRTRKIKATHNKQTCFRTITRPGATAH